MVLNQTDPNITYNLTQLQTPTKYNIDFDGLTYSAADNPGLTG